LYPDLFFIRGAMMILQDLCFQPVRSRLYGATELFEGFDVYDATSWAKTKDFAVYRQYVVEVKNSPKDAFVAMMEALHDSSIIQASTGVVSGKRVVAIMGGHKMRRDSTEYSKIAVLSRRLTRDGFLLSSGGGPGAMEATHLGAIFSNSVDSDLDQAISKLTSQPSLPSLNVSVQAPRVDLLKPRLADMPKVC
jgi:hypothetical protein